MSSASSCLILTLLIMIMITLISVTSVSSKIPAIIVFGDSTVDAGNNNAISTIIKSNFKPYGRDFFGGKPTGRFSNGRIPPDFISEAFGLHPFVPAYLDSMYNISDFATGVCFASAGTGFDNATSDVLSVIPLWKEIEYYKEYQLKLRGHLGDRKANKIISDSLYLISVGTNDFLENYYLLRKRRSQYTEDEYQNFLIGIANQFIKTLYSLGARKISLGGLPPMGCLPLERTINAVLRGEGCVESYNKVALSFNAKLGGLVLKLKRELSGAQIVFSNPYYIMMHILKNPLFHGFETVSAACCSTGMFEMSYLCNALDLFTCSDANKFVFWDSFHATDKTNSIIVRHLLKRVLYRFY